jgi:transposase
MAVKKKTTKKKSTTNKIGRPTKYKPEFCELLIECMKKGYSFEAFGSEVSISKQTLYDWVERYPEFSDAKNIGLSHARKFWENIAILACLGDNKMANPAIWVFNMKNRFGWRDKQPEEISDRIQPLVIDLPNAGRAIEIKGGK